MNTTYDINGRLWPRADDEKFYSRWSPENQKRFGGLANELPTPQAREVYKHKILGSLHIAASTGQPIDKIYQNFDSVSAQYYGKKITPKEVYEDANNFYHNEYAAYNRPWESIQPVKRGDQNDVIDAVKNTALGYSQPGFAATQGALHMGAVGWT